jgi:CRP-like cAMP-binding protein
MTLAGESLIPIKVWVDFLSTVPFDQWQGVVMANAPHPNGLHGPAIRAIDPWRPARSSPRMRQLLSEDERARLAGIASIVRFKKGALIYREGDPMDQLFNIMSGVVKVYRTAPDGSEHIAAFLFPDDLFGLPREGQYANSAKAVTAVIAYALPISLFRTHLAKEADLAFHMVSKLYQGIRQSQHHAFLLASRHARSRVAMFLQLLECLQAAKGEPTNEIYLPMDRSDIAEYLAISLPAASRAFRSLTADGIIASRDRRHVRILERQAFEALTGSQQATVPTVG